MGTQPARSVGGVLLLVTLRVDTSYWIVLRTFDRLLTDVNPSGETT